MSGRATSWLVWSAPVRALLLGAVLIVLGVTRAGYWPLIWVGGVITVVAAVGVVVLWRGRGATSRPDQGC